MIDEYKKYIIFSVIIHCLLFIIIAIPRNPPPQVYIQDRPTIKSYIYTPSKLNNEDIKIVETKSLKPIEIKENVESDLPVPLPISVNNKDQKNEIEDKNISTDVYTKNNTGKTEETTIKSAYQQLTNLREKITQQNIAEEIYQLQRKRSPSVMHGTPIPVPESKLQLTPEQKREQATTKYGGGVDVVKGDDGFCTVERDLSSIGMDGLKSYQGFACGESKMDKSFREHMKKVRAKLGQKP